MSAFFITDKAAPKMDKFSFFYLQRAAIFSIKKLDILIFCNTLHLEMDF